VEQKAHAWLSLAAESAAHTRASLVFNNSFNNSLNDEIADEFHLLVATRKYFRSQSLPGRTPPVALIVPITTLVVGIWAPRPAPYPMTGDPYAPI